MDSFVQGAPAIRVHHGHPVGLCPERTPSMHGFSSRCGDEAEHHLDLHGKVLSRGGLGWITLLAPG